MTGALLVTGASGFIGRHLLARLVAEERDAVAVPGRSPIAAAARVRLLPGRDMGPDTCWDHAFEGVRVVVHLAGLAHGRDRGDLRRMERVNVDGALVLAEAAAAAGVERFVFVSTIGVHGNETQGAPITEASPIRPQGAYAQTKWAAEQALRQRLEASAMALTVVRPTMVYGAGAPGNPARLRALVASDWPLPLASVRNRRSFLSVTNLCALLLRCADDERARGETFVAADDQVLSTPELLTLMARELGVAQRLLPCPAALLRVGAALLGRREDLARMIGDLEVDAAHLRRRLALRLPQSVEAGVAAWLGEAGHS